MRKRVPGSGSHASGSSSQTTFSFLPFSDASRCRREFFHVPKPQFPQLQDRGQSLLFCPTDLLRRLKNNIKRNYRCFVSYILQCGYDPQASVPEQARTHPTTLRPEKGQLCCRWSRLDYTKPCQQTRARGPAPEMDVMLPLPLPSWGWGVEAGRGHQGAAGASQWSFRVRAKPGSLRLRNMGSSLGRAQAGRAVGPEAGMARCGGRDGKQGTLLSSVQHPQHTIPTMGGFRASLGNPIWSCGSWL